MDTLRIEDGDLVLSGRDYVTVTGTAKVAQDLRGALLEPLGNDRFHPGWGSTVADYVAQIADEETRMEVETEVNRVVSNYAAIQRDKISADINADTASRFTTDEVLSRIRSINVTLDSVESVGVQIALQTASGETVVLNEAVGS